VDPVDAAAVAGAANPPENPGPRGLPKVIQSADERFAAVLDFSSYRLRDKRLRYGTKKAHRIGRTARDMKHSFGTGFHFTGKTPLKVFTRLRKLVKACNDNGVMEGMALYLIPHFLGGDAELQYGRALPDAGSRPGGTAITTYPEAINWFLQSYAEPHKLALAQHDFGQAVKADGESVEDFSHHLRELSELCGNIHQEGTMKQQLITGLPQHLRTDAHVYNRQDRTYQQLTTSLAGKDTAAQEVVQMARASLPAATSRRPPAVQRAPVASVVHPVMAVTPTPAVETPGPRTGTPARAAPTQAYRGQTLNLAAPRVAPRPATRDPFLCYICYEEGHRAHQCTTLTPEQREVVLKARDGFLALTRPPSGGGDKERQETRRYNRVVRVAVMQAINGTLEDSEGDATDAEAADSAAPAAGNE